MTDPRKLADEIERSIGTAVPSLFLSDEQLRMVVAALRSGGGEAAPIVLPLFIEEEGGGWRVCDKPNNDNGLAFCIIRPKLDDAIAEMIEHKRGEYVKPESK